MAVIVSNGDTNLHTANGFYRAESYNMGFYDATVLSLTTTRTIPVTFANAGNCKGLILSIRGDTNTTQDITVKLKESGTERASKTLTASGINTNTNSNGYWVIPFEFATPYTVDTTASKWTFEISQSGGAGTWYLVTSNGTAPSYVTWCDNVVTFADDDVLVCKDQVTVTASATTGSILGTGDGTYTSSILVCKSSTPPTKTNNVANLLVQNTTPATLTVKGLITLGSHSGFQVGTSTTPISSANPFKLLFGTASVGSRVGLLSAFAYTAPRVTILFYGEVPAVRHYTYTADAPVGQPYFDVADTTGITTGDVFWLSGSDSAWGAGTTTYTVTGTTATRVSITPNIAGYKKLAGFKAYKMTGYGIDLSWNGVTTPAYYVGTVSNLYMQGVRLWVSNTANDTGQTFTMTGGSVSQSGEYSAYRSKVEFYQCIRGAGRAALIGGYTPMNGIKISECYGFGSTVMITGTAEYDNWSEKGILEEYGNYSCGENGQRTASSTGYPTWKIENNMFENMAQGVLKGKLSIYRNNYIKGGSSGGWAIQPGDFINCVDWSNNTWHGTPVGLGFYSVVYNLTMLNEKRLSGLGIGGYNHISNISGALLNNVTMQDPDFDVTVTTYTYGGGDRTQLVDGSRIGVTGNNASNNAFSYMPYGNITKTGTSLADTTVRTAGGFAMRFEPANSNFKMHWEQNIPTGNIQNKTMTVSLWVKLNNAAYWAGTHTKPTLTIDYDNGTTITSVATASTSWQLLACTFTPATTYGQIEMKVTGATDATGTNRYFYVDDVNIAYPAGVAVNLGGLDLWADGLPVAPAIATVPSLGGVWDEPLTAHTIAGSAGVVVGELLSNTDATQAKVDTL